MMFIPTRASAEDAADRFGTPLFLTDAETLAAQTKKMRAAFGAEARIFYALKANYNPHIVRALKDAGIDGIDAVSPHEIRLALEQGFAPDRILYTPSNPSTAELEEAGKAGVMQNLGSLSEVRRFAEGGLGREVSLRICPEVGAGEFEAVTTGTLDSKFGIPMNDLDEARTICEAQGIDIVGIHCHIGSGFYDASAFKKAVESVSTVAKDFPKVRFIDLGGGFGVTYRPEQKEVDLSAMAEASHAALRSFKEGTGRTLELYLEPGKFLVSSSTVLLTRVTTVKEKGGRTFVGVDTGFNHLIRPAMYGAYHHVVNVSNPEGEVRSVIVAGNLCETGDVINHDIELTEPREGDLLAVLTAGGYGSAMSSTYNLRERAAEALVRDGELVLTRRRDTYEDLTQAFV